MFSRQTNKREGDPIASKYVLSAFKNRMILALARGLGQSSLALNHTAHTAVTQFIYEMKEMQSNTSELRVRIFLSHLSHFSPPLLLLLLLWL
jgi:hypothetical protein